MDFTGKVVLVTGAGVGIGRSACVMFAQRGAKVAVNSLTPANGEETLRQVLEVSEGIYVQGDVSKPEDARHMVERTVEKYGRIDILVNNAGVVIPGRIDTMRDDDWHRTMDVNLNGVYLVSRHVIGVMKRQGGGTIVNVSSAVALKGVKDRAAYSASKGGLLSLSKAMAADYMAENIRVNCICPGATMTPSLERRLDAFDDVEKATQDFIDRQPMKRFGAPDEIAMAILFAACDEAGFMNGSVISIDGGMTC